MIALSSSEEKLEYCRTNGADYLINYRTTDYVEEVLRITCGKGVDVSLNSVSGPTLEKDIRVIRPMGRLVIYGYSGGKGFVNRSEMVVLKSLTVNYFSVYTVVEREEYRQATDFLENWLHTEDLISVTKTFQLEDITAAHHWIESQRSYGKVVLVMK